MTAHPNDVDVAMIGHYALDKIIYLGKEQLSLGGAVYYGGVALRRQGFRVAVVTRLARRDWAMLDELVSEGIEVYAAEASATSGIENTYPTEDMNHRTCRPLAFAGAFRPEDIPDLLPRIWLVGPIIAGEVDVPLLRKLHASGAPVALDIQGFIRVPENDQLVFRPWPDMAEGLGYVKYLKADDAETLALTGRTDLREAARELAGYGPSEVALTHGGGLVVYAEGSFCEAAFRPSQIRGRTGRGDTTFATYVARRLALPPERACQYAAAVASLKMEAPGPFRRPLSDVEDYIRRRP
ncbi:MAG: hypothetical protein GXY76_11385 [Chloroflexi bacterium]|nr:hypothetical protein [Chloroflexota bacterium]